MRYNDEQEKTQTYIQIEKRLKNYSNTNKFDIMVTKKIQEF